MTHEELVRAYWHRVWSSGDVDFALEFYAPTFRKDGQEISAADFAASAGAWRSKFEDFEARVDRVFTIEGGAVSRVTYRGRQVADIAGVPEAGRSFDITGLDVFLFEGGRCVEHLHEADHHTMFEQLGAG